MSVFYEERIENYITLTIENNVCSPHLHRHIELMYMAKGSMDITVNSVCHNVKEGQCALIFPNMVHSGTSAGNSLAFYFIFNTGFISEYKTIFEKYLPKCPVISLEGKEAAKSALTSLSRLMNNSSDIMLCKGYLTVFLAEILKDAKLIRHDNISDYDICQKLLMFLDNHYTEEINLEKISKNLGVNKFYISHILSEKLNTSLPAYLTLRRIERAKTLLITTANPITDVAYDSGFSSIRSFYRSFKSQCGCSPTAFRRQFAPKTD